MKKYLTKSIVYDSIIHGSLVKRLRRRPLTAETRVRFPYGLLSYQSSVYTDSCETVVDTGFFVFLYGHIWNRNVGLECRNKITYETMGIKVMHLVKLEEIPGAKEELKKFANDSTIGWKILLHFQSNSQNTQETLQNRAFLVSRRYIMTSIRVLFVCHGRAMESQ